MAPFNPHISLTALGKIQEITVPDPKKPNSFILYCDIHIDKIGRLTIPVSKYFENGSVPPVDSYVSLCGPFWIPRGADGSIEAETLEVVTIDLTAELWLPVPSVMAVGNVATVIGREIYMDVGAYSRESKSIKTYQIIVTVPNNPCRANMKMPQAGSNVFVQGILSDISLHEEVMVDELSVGTRTKRQLLAKKTLAPADIGRPMKKTKSGPPEAFTPEELGAGNPSLARSSQASVASSSQSSVGGSSQSSHNASSSESSVGSSPPPPVKNSIKLSLRSGRLEANKAN